MTNNIVVRELTIEDVDSLFILRLESLQKHPGSFLSSYEEEKKAGSMYLKNILTSSNTKNAIFGAFIQDKLIGIAGLSREELVKAAHKCTLWGMYVQESYRQYGVAKKLLQTMIKHARVIMQCLSINLTVSVANAAAKNLYESYGFKIWGIESQAIWVDQVFYDECHMSLLL